MAILAIDFVIIDSSLGSKFRNYKKKITGLVEFSFLGQNVSLKQILFERRDFFKII